MEETLQSELFGEFATERMPEMAVEHIAAFLADAIHRDQAVPDPIPPSAEREIEVVLDAQGHLVIATSKKIGNIRFNLKKALLEGVSKTAPFVISSIDYPWLAPLLALSYLAFLQELSTITVSDEDAEVAVELFRIVTEERSVDLDDFYRHMESKMTVEAVDASLDRLEKIGALTRLKGEVVLNEDIRVVSR